MTDEFAASPETPEAAPALDVERRVADALLAWFDSTHGEEFGHDHHCPLQAIQLRTGDLYSKEMAGPDCTCGWSDVIDAMAARLASERGAKPRE